MLHIHSTRQNHFHKTLQQSITLLNLVEARRGLGATDSRDIIWAHLNLASDGHDRLLKPDYKRTLLAKLFNDFARLHVMRVQSYDDFLHAHGRLDGKLAGLASWAPDWRHTLLECCFRSTAHRNPSLLSDEQGIYLSIEDPPILINLGHSFNVVLKTTTPHSLLQFPEEKKRVFSTRFS